MSGVSGWREDTGGLFGHAACPVLHIAGDVLDSALRLVGLPCRLHLLVAGHLADGFFYGALGLVEGATHMFASHNCPQYRGLEAYKWGNIPKMVAAARTFEEWLTGWRCARPSKPLVVELLYLVRSTDPETARAQPDRRGDPLCVKFLTQSPGRIFWTSACPGLEVGLEVEI
jgi:hypothetical protein